MTAYTKEGDFKVLRHRIIVLLTMISLFACGGNSGNTGTSSSSIVGPTEASTSVAPSPTTQQGAAGPSQNEANFYSGGEYSILAGEDGAFYIYETSFDDQTTPLTGSTQKWLLASGEIIHEKLKYAKCTQADVSLEGFGGRPFAWAYYTADGTRVKSITPEQRAACSKPDPQPTPSPSPSPSPTPRPSPTPCAP